MTRWNTSAAVILTAGTGLTRRLKRTAAPRADSDIFPRVMPGRGDEPLCRRGGAGRSRLAAALCGEAAGDVRVGGAQAIRAAGGASGPVAEGARLHNKANERGFQARGRHGTNRCCLTAQRAITRGRHSAGRA